jgi:hypothetical protein
MKNDPSVGDVPPRPSRKFARLLNMLAFVLVSGIAYSRTAQNQKRETRSREKRQEGTAVTHNDQPEIIKVDDYAKGADPDTQDKDAAPCPPAGARVEPVNEVVRDQVASNKDQEHCASKDHVVGDRGNQDSDTKMVRYTALATLVIAFMNMLQFGAFWVTISDTKRSALAAEKSAAAAEDAVGITRDTAVRQLRAYVSVERANLVIQGNKAYIALRTKNFGQTPAYEVTARSQSGIRHPGEPANANSREVWGMPKIVLGPGDSRALDIFVDLRPGDLASLRSGRSVIYVEARIDYKDAFDHPRFTEVRMHSSNGPDGGVSFAAEREGNSAN